MSLVIETLGTLYRGLANNVQNITVIALKRVIEAFRLQYAASI